MNALQNELQLEVKSRISTPSEIDETGNVTIIEQQMPKLETEYRQKRQILGQ